MSDGGIVMGAMAKTDIQSAITKTVLKDFKAQQQLGRVVSEVPRNLEDGTIKPCWKHGYGSRRSNYLVANTGFVLTNSRNFSRNLRSACSLFTDGNHA
jgi:hypothetical protein